MKYLRALELDGYDAVRFVKKEQEVEYYDVKTNGSDWEPVKVENGTLFMKVEEEWEEEGRIQIVLDPSEIEEGDFVDFGGYGELYVLRKDAGLVSDGLLWCSDEEEDRYTEDARGKFISESFARSIIEKGQKYA